MSKRKTVWPGVHEIIPVYLKTLLRHTLLIFSGTAKLSAVTRGELQVKSNQIKLICTHKIQASSTNKNFRKLDVTSRMSRDTMIGALTDTQEK